MAEEPDLDIKATMLEVARAVALTAKGATVAFSDQIDALKALTAAYTALQKHPDDGDDSKTGDGFDFSKGIPPDEEPPDDRVTPIRTRRRP